MTGTWCHGEAGIALTRLRATAVLGPGPCADDAEVAIATTRRHLARALPYEFEDLSLCHGLGGSADALICAGAGDAAAEFGRVALQRQTATERDWACGVDGDTTPGLFLGLSGIAWWFLRLHDHTIPSPLCLPTHG
jgi:lantibiotic modifying enzyme